MNIRAKITLTFFALVIIVLSAISFSIYFSYSNYREIDFYRRLKNRAINTAKLLTEIEEINADLLKRIERNNPASLPNQYITIYNYKNKELYNSETSPVIPFDTTLLNKIRLEKQIRFKYANYEALGFLFTDKYDRFTIVAAATDIYGLEALNNLRNVLIITFCISIVLIPFLGWIYAGRVLSPITKILNDVDSITEINLNQRLPEGENSDEISMLAKKFNNMLERLQSAFTAQKHFIANASHEIKTPITIMAAEIEVTLLHERDKEKYVKALKSILTGLKGLNQLSTQLLLLAQTSAEEPDKKFISIRIDDILWETKDELVKANPLYHIDLEFSLYLNHESLLIRGDVQLMKVAILNLMDNGCKYSEDSRVLVNIHSKSPGFVAIEFINNGKGIDNNDLNKIFAPFYRGTNSKKEKGFGIGLSLVKTIMKLHNGSISVKSVPNDHTCFTLNLPLEQ